MEGLALHSSARRFFPSQISLSCRRRSISTVNPAVPSSSLRYDRGQNQKINGALSSISLSSLGSVPQSVFLRGLSRPALPQRRKSLKPIAATPPQSSAKASSAPAWQGARIAPLALSVAVGLIVTFLVPKPVEVTQQGWQLLGIFLSTVTGLVVSPLPVGAWAFIGLTATVITRTLSFSAAFNAFTNEVIWLVVISFFFARGFVKTGLGDRIATYFVKWLGKSTLGLSYGLTISEALISPAMPSTTARAGGVFLPIIQSLSLSAGSKPNNASSKKLGAYLIQSQFQVHSSSPFLILDTDQTELEWDA